MNAKQDINSEHASERKTDIIQRQKYNHKKQNTWDEENP
jgi:hypothetical protein